MQLHITSEVYRNDKDKEGNPFIGRNGNPYSKIAFKTKEFGNDYVRGYCSDWNAGWKTGDIVEGDVKQVKGADGKTYLNLSKPDPLAEMSKTIMDVLKRLTALEKDVAGLKSLLDQPETEHDEEPPADELLPF